MEFVSPGSGPNTPSPQQPSLLRGDVRGIRVIDTNELEGHWSIRLLTSRASRCLTLADGQHVPLRPIYNVMVMKLGVQKSKEQFGCDDRRNVD